jgi:small subunit ribosomal protein S16
LSVHIRLTRAGRRHLPFYHIAVFDVRVRRDGAPIEELGFYDPNSKTEPVRLDVERAKFWLSNGAKPSETMASILKRSGLTVELWQKPRVKASKPKVSTALKKAEKDKARGVKKRTKPRTANSKLRAERKAAKKK